jgi:hypothetical protein
MAAVGITGYSFNRVTSGAAISGYGLTGNLGNRKLIALLFISGNSNINFSRVYLDNGGSGVNFVSIFNSSILVSSDPIEYIRMSGYYLDRPPVNHLCRVIATFSNTLASGAYGCLGVYTLNNAKQGSVAYNNWAYAALAPSIYIGGIQPTSDNSVHLSLVSCEGEVNTPTPGQGLSLDEGNTLWWTSGAIGHENRTNSSSDGIQWVGQGSTEYMAASVINVSYSKGVKRYQRCFSNIG